MFKNFGEHNTIMKKFISIGRTVWREDFVRVTVEKSI